LDFLFQAFEHFSLTHVWFVLLLCCCLFVYVFRARVFSWDSGNNLGEITMHSHPVISCSYRKVRPFRVATGSEDLSVNMYEGPPFKYSQSFKGQRQTQTHVSNDICLLACWRSDKLAI